MGNPQKDATQIFSKPLSATDVKYRLAWPSEHLISLMDAGKPWGASDLNLSPSRQKRVIRVFDRKGKRYFSLRCCTRRTGRYLKPVVSAGWRKLVQAMRLRRGDRIAFNSNPDPAVDADFVFTVLTRAA